MMTGIPSAKRAQRKAGYRNDIKWRIYIKSFRNLRDRG
jgi:hypothetical protein